MVKKVKYMNAEEVEKFKIQLQDDGYANTPQKYSNEVLGWSIMIKQLNTVQKTCKFQLR